MRPTIKIGLVAPFEGRYRAVGYDVIYAARLALREVNQAGGVAGYAVELVAYDDRAQPAMAVEQVHKLDADPDVLGVIGHFREGTTHAAAPIYAQAGLPLIALGVLDPQFAEEHAALYRLGPPAAVMADALLERAAELINTCPESASSGAAVVLLGQGGPLGASLEDLASDWEAANPGWRFVSLSADAAGWRGDVLAHDPTVILSDLDPVRAGEVVVALHEEGWAGPVLGGPSLAASDFAAVAGQFGYGAEFVTPWPFPLDVPRADAFAAAYRSTSAGLEPGPLAIPTYEATWILIDALGRAATAGAPTRQSVAAALPSVEREGLLGRIAFDAERVWSADALYWYRIGPEGVPLLVETACWAVVPWPVRPSRQ